MADKPPSTAAKVALGAGVVAALGGLLAAFGSKKTPTRPKPMGKCGACGR